MIDIVERLKTGRSDDSHFIWTVTPTHVEAADEITRLRQLLSEADKREAEARAKALEEAAKVAWIEGWKSPDEISAAIRALQSEER